MNSGLQFLFLQDSECSDINYFYELVLYGGMTTRVSSKTIECSEGRVCTTSLIVSRNSASNHIVITRSDVSGGSSYTSDSFGELITVILSNCIYRISVNLQYSQHVYLSALLLQSHLIILINAFNQADMTAAMHKLQLIIQVMWHIRKELY